MYQIIILIYDIKIFIDKKKFSYYTIILTIIWLYIEHKAIKVYNTYNKRSLVKK